MFLERAIVISVVVAFATAAFAEDRIVFPMKVFTDLGHIVHVEGTLAGQGIGYPDNHTSLTCYQDRHECIVINIESEGRQIFSLDLPGLLDTQIWTSERIVADEALPCGPPPGADLKDRWQKIASTTWIIDRTRKTADLIQNECMSGTTYRFSIEEPFWNKMK